MTHSNNVSIRYTTIAMMMEAVNTTIALCVNSCLVGHVVLCDNSSYESLQYAIIFWNIYVSFGTGREAGRSKAPSTHLDCQARPKAPEAKAI